MTPGRPLPEPVREPASQTAPEPLQRSWRVLVVDDDEEVRLVSRLVLRDFQFEGRGIEILEAASAAAARSILEKDVDVALVLLDVVMESEHAGLDLVRQIRDELLNRAVRIVLRTGQPGQAPPLEVLAQYEIDDYHAKPELTAERLLIVVMSGLRAYRQIRALIETNRELERFAYAASHDLQTPLRSIVSFSQLLQRHLPGDDAKAHELLGYILRSSRDLQELVDSLLQYSRASRPGGSQPVPLDEVVQRSVARLDALVRERAARIAVEPLPRVMGVAVHLEQLFANLIENAIKYQPGERPVVEISSRLAGPRCEVRVRDRGIGIPAQHLDRIFEPFTRLHRSDEVPGSGIGLATCRRIAELHGGSVRAESAQGQGTTMVVSLPAAPADSAGQPRTTGA